MTLIDEESHAAVQNCTTAPLVAIFKYPEPYDEVNPSFKVNLKPYGGLKGENPEEIISLPGQTQARSASLTQAMWAD